MLERLQHQPYDAVIFDMQLTDMDGRALAAAIRGREQTDDWSGTRPIRLIGLVAGGQSENRGQLLSAGIDATLSSPLTLATLSDCLARRCE